MRNLISRFLNATLMLLLRVTHRYFPMAFSATQMNRLHVGTVGVWFYKTTDAIATVAASGYFNSYTNDLRNGDAICVIDTNVNSIDWLMVSSADNAATVTTVNGT